MQPTLDTFCSYPGCANRRVARGWCHTHWKRWRRHGDPSITMPTGRPRGRANSPGVVHSQYKGDDIGYAQLHLRLKQQRGKATEHTCPCGAQAQEWSFDTPGGGFSVDLTRYTALCLSCHRRKDAA